MATEAQEFYTNALYPGGEGGCRITTTDPYPDGIPAGDIYKADFAAGAEAQELLKKVWKMKEYEVDFNARWFAPSIPETLDAGSFTDGFSCDVKGQYDVEANFRLSYEFERPDGVYNIRVFNFPAPATPVSKICGNFEFTGIANDNFDFEEEIVSGTTKGSVILPRVFMQNIFEDRIGESGTVTNTKTVEGVEMSRSWINASAEGHSKLHYYTVELNVLRFYLKPDGSLSVYFLAQLKCIAGSFFSTESLIGNPETNYWTDSQTVDSKSSVHAVNLNFMGKSVPAKLYLRSYASGYIDSGSWYQFDGDFTFSYDINVTEYYS